MLRVRLVLWYAFLVVLTVAAVGAVQYALLSRSLTTELDASLLDDAKATLSKIQNRSAAQITRMHVHTQTNQNHESLKELVDDALAHAPDSLSGDELTDRVLASLMDEILLELSAKDSNASDPLDLIVEQMLTSRRNNLVEVFTRVPDSSGQTHVVFRTKNLAAIGGSLQKVFSAQLGKRTDSILVLGSQTLDSDVVRGAYASTAQFGVIVAYSTADINDSISKLLTTYLYLLPLALFVASIGGFFLSRRALKPIEEIAETAQEISAKNLSRRITMPARQDREMNLLVATLNSMFGRLERSFEQIEQFSSDASHELKTPLAILRGEIEQSQRRLAQHSSLDRVDAERMLASMSEEVERMQRIVEGLLLLAKADDRRLAFEAERFDIAAFLHSIAEDAEILAADRELSFESDIQTDVCMVVADRTRLYQVMMNLFDNALKYTPRGGKVSIFLANEGGSVQFGVADTGKGIAPEDLEKIFLRFFRTEEARSHQGAEYVARSLGLGLALVKSIVEAMGGSIAVESTLGQGSKFTVTLPLAA